MRIPAGAKADLQNTIRFVLDAEHNAGVVADYSRNGWTQQRLAWDILWEAVRTGLIDIQGIYSQGVNDSHIERAIMAVTPDPQGYSNRKAVDDSVELLTHLSEGDRVTLDGKIQARIKAKHVKTVTLTLLDQHDGHPTAVERRRVRPQRLSAPLAYLCELPCL